MAESLKEFTSSSPMAESDVTELMAEQKAVTENEEGDTASAVDETTESKPMDIMDIIDMLIATEIAKKESSNKIPKLTEPTVNDNQQSINEMASSSASPNEWTETTAGSEIESTETTVQDNRLWERLTGMESMMFEVKDYRLQEEQEHIVKGLRFYKKAILKLQKKVYRVKEHKRNLRFVCELNHLIERQRLAFLDYEKIAEKRKIVQQYIRPDGIKRNEF